MLRSHNARRPRKTKPTALVRPGADRRRPADGRARRDDREHRPALRAGGSRLLRRRAPVGSSPRTRCPSAASAPRRAARATSSAASGSSSSASQASPAASAIGGFAPSFGVLVVARALQGAFARCSRPAALSISRRRSPSPRSATARSACRHDRRLRRGRRPHPRRRLTQYLDWRWSMFINVLLAAPAALAALRLLASDVPASSGARIDVAGHVTRRPACSPSCSASPTPRRTGGARRSRSAPSPPASPCWAPSWPSSAASPPAAARCASSPDRQPQRRLPRGGRRSARPVRRLPVPHLLHAADPGLLAAGPPARVPADDGRAHPGRGHRPDRACCPRFGARPLVSRSACC
jgi:hypothetical protein